MMGEDPKEGWLKAVRTLARWARLAGSAGERWEIEERARAGLLPCCRAGFSRGAGDHEGMAGIWAVWPEG